MKDIIEQLIYIYLHEEDWHKAKLSHKDSRDYFSSMISKGRIQIVLEEEEVIGYVESWRLSYEQWGRKVCHETIHSMTEDVSGGPVCYLANIWIRKEKRRGDTLRKLRDLFFYYNSDSEYFVGHALRKKTQPIKVLKKIDFYNKHIKKKDNKGDNNG